ATKMKNYTLIPKSASCSPQKAQRSQSKKCCAALDAAKAFHHWYIEGNKDYGGHYNSDGVQIRDHLQFLDFATQAYDAYAKQIHIKVIREAPPKALQVDRIDINNQRYVSQ
ncbi:hypothetical protein PCANC_14889, partial [Puccinia coronata f. sp. avenae]